MSFGHSIPIYSHFKTNFTAIKTLFHADAHANHVELFRAVSGWMISCLAAVGCFHDLLIRSLSISDFRLTELWRLDLFSCTSSSFLCAGTLSPRGKCCYFCGRFNWSRQTSLSKGFSYYFHYSTTELYFRSTTRQCRCYSKT